MAFTRESAGCSAGQLEKHGLLFTTWFCLLQEQCRNLKGGEISCFNHPLRTKEIQKAKQLKAFSKNLTKRAHLQIILYEVDKD